MDDRFLESAAFWSNIAVVSASVLAAILAGFALYFSSRLAVTKDAELGKLQAEAQVAVAAAAARAREAEGRAAGATAAAADANQRTGKLELEAAQQRERATTAERQLLELRQTAAPRSFTPDQRDRLIASLAAADSKGLVTVAALLGDGEAAAFAIQIRDILMTAGWTTAALEIIMFLPRRPVGTELHLLSIADAPRYAAVLRNAFEAVGISLPEREIPNLEAGKVRVTVGTKPE